MNLKVLFTALVCSSIPNGLYGQSFTFDPQIVGPLLNISKSNFYGTFSSTKLDEARLFFCLADNPANGTRITIGELGSKSNRLELKASASKNLLLGSSGRSILFNDSNNFIGFGDEFAPHNLYHFRSASSGVNSQISGTQLMKIENNDDAFINFSIPDDKKAGIQFSKPGNLFVGSIRLTEGNAMDFRVNENSTKMRISSIGNVSIGRGNTGSFSGAGLLHINTNGTEVTKFILSHKYPTVSENFELSLDSLNIAKIVNQRAGQLVLGSNSLEAIRINSSGSVGIQESSSPINASLHINKNDPGILITRTADANNGLRIKYSSADLADIINEKNNALRFGTNGGIKMTLTSSGQLMIGNLSGASSILHAHQDIVTAKTVLKITNGLTGTVGTDGFDIGFDENSLNSRVWNYENGSLILGTNNLVRMSISSLGNVGINDPNSSAKLAIAGDLALSSKTVNASTGDLNDFPRNGRSVIRFSGTGAVNLSGIEAGPDGTILYIYTTSAVSNFTIKNENTSSLSSNRIITGAGNASGDEFVFGEGAVSLIYDGTSSRWRVMSIKQ